MKAKHNSIISKKNISQKYKLLFIVVLLLLISAVIPTAIFAQTQNTCDSSSYAVTGNSIYENKFVPKLLNTSIDLKLAQDEVSQNGLFEVAVQHDKVFELNEEEETVTFLYDKEPDEPYRTKYLHDDLFKNHGVNMEVPSLFLMSDFAYFSDPSYAFNGMIDFNYWYKDPVFSNRYHHIKQIVSPLTISNETSHYKDWDLYNGDEKKESGGYTTYVENAKVAGTCVYESNKNSHLVYVDYNGCQFDSDQAPTFLPGNWHFCGNSGVCSEFVNGTTKQTVENELSQFQWNNFLIKGEDSKIVGLRLVEDYDTITKDVEYIIKVETKFSGNLNVWKDTINGYVAFTDEFSVSFYGPDNNLIKTALHKEGSLDGYWETTLLDEGNNIAYEAIQAKGYDPIIKLLESPIPYKECQTITNLAIINNANLSGNKNITNFEISDNINYKYYKYSTKDNVCGFNYAPWKPDSNSGGRLHVDENMNLVYENLLDGDVISCRYFSPRYDQTNYILTSWLLNDKAMIPETYYYVNDYQMMTEGCNLKVNVQHFYKANFDGDKSISYFEAELSLDGQIQKTIDIPKPEDVIIYDNGQIFVDEISRLCIHYDNPIYSVMQGVYFDSFNIYAIITQSFSFVDFWKVNDYKLHYGDDPIGSDKYIKDGKCEIFCEKTSVISNANISAVKNSDVFAFNLKDYICGEPGYIDIDVPNSFDFAFKDNAVLSLDDSLRLRYTELDQFDNPDYEVVISPILNNACSIYKWTINGQILGPADEIVIQPNIFYDVKLDTIPVSTFYAYSDDPGFDGFNYSTWILDPEYGIIDQGVKQSYYNDNIWINHIINITADGQMNVDYWDDGYTEGLVIKPFAKTGYKLDSWTINGINYKIDSDYHSVLTFKEGVPVYAHANFILIDDDHGKKDDQDLHPSGTEKFDKSTLSPQTGDLSWCFVVILSLIAIVSTVCMFCRK